MAEADADPLRGRKSERVMAQIDALLSNKAGVVALLVALMIGARVGAISSNELYPAWAWLFFAPSFSVLEAMLIAAMVAAYARCIIWPTVAAVAAVATAVDTMPAPTAVTSADKDCLGDGAETQSNAPGLKHSDPAPVPFRSVGKLCAITEDSAEADSEYPQRRYDAVKGAAGETIRARSAPAALIGRVDAPEHGTPSSATAARVHAQENGVGYGESDGSDICETELGSCIAALRGIDADAMNNAAVNVALAAVLRRLETAGDDLTSPVLKDGADHRDSEWLMSPLNLSLVKEYGLKAKPAPAHRRDSAPVYRVSEKHLYAPIPAENSSEGPGGSGRRLSVSSISFEKKFGNALEDSWNLGSPGSPSDSWNLGSPGSPSTADMEAYDESQYSMPKSPGDNGYRSTRAPKWQQGMAQVVVDSVELAQWEFDPFKATKVNPALNGQDVHGDHTVSSVPFALRMLADHQLFDELDIEMDCMKRYLRRVERDYKCNPYHNRVHGFDVMQTCHCVLMQSPALRDQLSAIDKLALLVGAFVHDVGHPGVNNKLLIKLAETPDYHHSRDLKSRDRCRQLAQYAITYNSKSVLESFHISRAFQLAFDTREADANPFHKIPQEDFAKLRSLMVGLVLATDMENHFSLVTKMKHLTADTSGNLRLLDLHDDSEKETLLKAIMHGCDVGNPTKPIALAEMWTDVISEEFWAQGEFEIELGFKPERMLERQDTATKHGRFAQAQGQLAFIKYIVKPLHDVLATQLPIFGEKSVKNLSAVVGHWERILHENAGDPAERP